MPAGYLKFWLSDGKIGSHGGGKDVAHRFEEAGLLHHPLLQLVQRSLPHSFVRSLQKILHVLRSGVRVSRDSQALPGSDWQ